MEVEISINRPIPLGGATFIKTSFGVISAKDNEMVSKYKSKLSKLLNDLLKELQIKYGKDAFIAISYIITAEDNTKEPKEIIIRKITFWEPTKILTEPIIVENPNKTE